MFSCLNWCAAETYNWLSRLCHRQRINLRFLKFKDSLLLYSYQTQSFADIPLEPPPSHPRVLDFYYLTSNYEYLLHLSLEISHVTSPPTRYPGCLASTHRSPSFHSSLLSPYFHCFLGPFAVIIPEFSIRVRWPGLCSS